MTYTIDELKALVVAAHPAYEHWTCADCCDAARTRTKLAAAVPELIARCEELEADNKSLAALARVAPEDVEKVVAENDRMQRAFSEAIDKLKSGGSVRFSSCEWCGESWPKLDGCTAAEVEANARRHVYRCAKHPMKAERDAMQEDRDALRAQVEQLTRERDEMERMLETEQDRTAEQHGATMQPFRDALLKEQAAQVDQLKSALRLGG